jgi:zinc transporter ZupT
MTMAERASEVGARRRGPLGVAAAVLLPLLLLAIIVYAVLSRGPGAIFITPVPVERLDFERVAFRPHEIVVTVRNSGPQPVVIAQIIVNGALWNFSAFPGQEVPRLGRARLVIPFDWVEAEPYAVEVITGGGFKFGHEVDAAFLTPGPTREAFWAFALLGLYVGVIPVYLGLAWLPALRRLSRRGWGALLGLTVGLLVFLGIDALTEALEVAERIPGIFQGVGLITIGTLGSFLGLVALNQRLLGAGARKGPFHARLTLAYLIALGIGLHNLGEGLAIGAAYVLGEISLGTLLVVGFMIHNITEGPAILAPVARAPEFRGRRLATHLVLLGMLGGAPTIAGGWLGGLVYSDPLAVLFLAVGSGAIFQVVYEVTRFMSREAEGGLGHPVNFAGFLAGLVLMYVTALFVAG